MTDILLFVIAGLLVIAVVILLMVLSKISKTDTAGLNARLDVIKNAEERTEKAVRDEAARSREELGKAAKEQRQELSDSFKSFGDTVVTRMADATAAQKGQFDIFSGNLNAFAQASGERLDAVRQETATSAKQLREEMVNTLKTLSETITRPPCAKLGDIPEYSVFRLFPASSYMFAQASGRAPGAVTSEFGYPGKAAPRGSGCNAQLHFRDDLENDEGHGRGGKEPARCLLESDCGSDEDQRRET